MTEGANPNERARPIKLPLLRILLGAFTLPGRHFAAVSRVAATPMLLVIACTLASQVIAPGYAPIAWTIYIAYSLAACWLAIRLHRLVLAPGDGADPGARHPLIRLAVFFTSFAVFLGLRIVIPIVLVSGYVFTQPVLAPTAAPPPPLPIPAWVTAITWIVTFWVGGRLLLIFPAIAINRPADPAVAWSLSRGNGWRLAIIAALPWALEKAVSLLWRENGTPVEFAILVVLMAATTIITVVAVSLAYWELTSPAPPAA